MIPFGSAEAPSCCIGGPSGLSELQAKRCKAGTGDVLAGPAFFLFAPKQPDAPRFLLCLHVAERCSTRVAVLKAGGFTGSVVAPPLRDRWDIPGRMSSARLLDLSSRRQIAGEACLLRPWHWSSGASGRQPPGTAPAGRWGGLGDRPWAGSPGQKKWKRNWPSD